MSSSTTVGAHMLVKNEERYLWFAAMAVLPHVDRLVIWDTGSTDSTPEIIGEIKKKGGNRVVTRRVGEINPDEFSQIRQMMLKSAVCDWVMTVDGDEVWWSEKVDALCDVIRSQGGSLESLVVKYYNVIGDIFHYQNESAGKYEIDGQRGNLSVRAMNVQIPGLFASKPHGQQGYFDGDGKLIQDRDPSKRWHMDGYSYLHFTHMHRSQSNGDELNVPKRMQKYKHEKGIEFPLDFYYPESLFSKRPDIIPSPWNTIDYKYQLLAEVETPLRKIKRSLIKGKSGY